MPIDLRAEFPKKLNRLFEPYRYKVAYGGRGSAKSWSFARALLIKGAAGTLRWLCAREVQNSIKQSVHQLLSDQINELGLGPHYEVLQTEIRGRNGTLFSFTGLSTHTVDSIKSFEGYDGCWVEEAQTVSKKSWTILVPTIRKADSEIWVSFNPELDTDETYQRFVVSPPPNSLIVEINYSDNPWFPDVLEQERKHCKITSPDDYPTIWEGKCRSSVSGAIYGREVDTAIRESRVCNTPYDPKLKVHTIWDLGWNDSMVVLFVQRLRSEIRIIDYIEDSHRTLDSYLWEIKERRYNWGHDWIPHDGDAKDFKTGRSAKDLLKAFGRRPKIIPKLDVESGIKMARMIFGQTYFDKTKTLRLFDCLKRYRRAINAQTNEPGSPVHDEYSHGADAYRYLAVVAEKLSNEDDKRDADITPFVPFDRSIGW